MWQRQAHSPLNSRPWGRGPRGAQNSCLEGGRGQRGPQSRMLSLLKEVRGQPGGSRTCWSARDKGLQETLSKHAGGRSPSNRMREEEHTEPRRPARQAGPAPGLCSEKPLHLSLSDNSASGDRPREEPVLYLVPSGTPGSGPFPPSGPLGRQGPAALCKVLQSLQLQQPLSPCLAVADGPQELDHCPGTELQGEEHLRASLERRPPPLQLLGLSRRTGTCLSWSSLFSQCLRKAWHLAGFNKRLLAGRPLSQERSLRSCPPSHLPLQPPPPHSELTGP